MIRPLAMIAFFGVRYFGWRRENKRGMSPSRPIAKATREAEKIKDGRAARAPTRTPAVITTSPRRGLGNARCAATARDAWFRSPGFPVPRTAMVTKATATKITVAMPRVRKFARGMSFAGFRVSSPVWAMISYPSKTMNVRPIVIRITTNGGDGARGGDSGGKFAGATGGWGEHTTAAQTYVGTIARRADRVRKLGRPLC